jgi:D-alanyl-D-alanine carboxypeptidase
MAERFAKDIRREVIGRAVEEARTAGSATVEAEHLLLALADHEALADAGLDRDALLDALDRETERSLAAVGVSLSAFDVPPARSRGRDPRFAASAKLALHRAVKLAGARRDRRIAREHVLVGLLRAEVGTVPRALETAGVDRAELMGRAEAALD